MRPHPTSLCHQSAGLRLVPGKNTAFMLCQLLPEKYPAQPIARCPAFSPKERCSCPQSPDRLG